MGASKGFVLAVAILTWPATAAMGLPILQLYIEGATYEPASETWVLDHRPDHFRLWVVAQTPVHDVKLAIAYEAGAAPSLQFTGSATGGFGGFVDPSAATAPGYIRTVTDGSLPKLGDGSDLPAHGVYGPGIEWQEFLLGDFLLADSPLADFTNSFPGPGNKWGQINVYEMRVSASSPLHFDVYDHVGGGNHAKYVFAPFSHDGEASSPEPHTGLLFLLMAGLATFTIRRR